MLARTVLRSSRRFKVSALEPFCNVGLPTRREREELPRGYELVQGFHTDSALREFKASPVVESTTPLVVGLGVAAIAYGGKVAIEVRMRRE